MLAIKDLSFSIQDKLIFENISLEISAGSRTSILGPSGAGKSSLLKILAGLEIAQSGSIHFQQQCWNENGRLQLPCQQRGVGLAFQSQALWPQMTVLKHLQFVAPKAKATDCERLLCNFRLENRMNAYPDQLSGGERQRLSLARTLIQQPKLLLLDEPVVQLDRQLQLAILSDLLNWLDSRPEMTAILVTHNSDIADSFSDRMVVIHQQRLLFDGTFIEARNSPKNSTLVEVLGFGDFIQVSAADFQEAQLTMPTDWPKLESNQGYYFRPEQFSLFKTAPEAPHIVGRVLLRHGAGIGYKYRIEFQLGRKTVVLNAHSTERFQRRDEVFGLWNSNPIVIDADS